MKRIVLAKIHPEIQLAHLYEHLFCNQVELLFYDAGLFPSLDYMLVGKTYHGGVVFIELEPYTEKAVEVGRKITSLGLDLKEVNVMNAASEILAEKEEPFASKGFEKIKQALMDLHEKDWVNIDDLSFIDAKQIRRKPGPFYITEGKPLVARKLEVSIIIDGKYAKSKRGLMPLFLQLSWLMSATLQGILPGMYGMFSFDDGFSESKEGVGIRNIFKIAYGSEFNAKELISSVKEVAIRINDNNGFVRLVDRLVSLSYGTGPLHTLPNIEKNYEDTLILMGASGWREIATEHNCTELLNHAFVKIKFGKDAYSVKLYE